MGMQFGLDQWVREGFATLQGRSVAVVCNQASISHAYVHILDHMLEGHHRGEFEVACAFGPQHGIWGHTQDNMIEWEGYVDPRTGFRFHSLYGERREPTAEQLQRVERLVFDVPDIGSRYYTFIWTLALCMKACERLGIPVTVLDRPNPIGCTQREGGVLEPRFASFVGLHPLPIRHGLTLGEVATHLRRAHYPGVDLEVVELQGYDRALYQDEAAAAWAMPSPNMPTVDTATVYPGMCLIEGTCLSEGRGTTRPFEIVGAPYIDGWELAQSLNQVQLPGVVFRPIQFEPTFQKYAQQICQGVFLHVTDRRAFQPVLTAVALLAEVVRLYPEHFEWLQPPYEYEYDLMPIDILAGNDWLRPAIEAYTPIHQVDERLRAELKAFEPALEEARLYRPA